MEQKNEKKYSGYGYHGGGRPKKLNPKNKTISISGTEQEVEEVKSKAKAAGLSVSRFIFNKILK